MAGKIEKRLSALGIDLPGAAAPAANYVPFVITGNQIWISGQLPFRDGKVQHQGKIGADLTAEDGVAAARLCGLNIIAQAQAAVGDLDNIRRIIKLGGFVNAVPDFTDHPKVINGASDMIVDVFGDRRPARALRPRRQRPAAQRRGGDRCGH